MFHFHNGSCLAFMFSSFLMTLFLLPTERRNKIRVRKGKFFDECVGMLSSFLMMILLQTERRKKIRVRKSKFFDECVSSVSADVSVVCRPTCWLTCLPTCRWNQILYLYRNLRCKLGRIFLFFIMVVASCKASGDWLLLRRSHW